MNKGLIWNAALVVGLLLGISCGKATHCSTCNIRIEDTFGIVSFKSGQNTISFPEARIWKARDTAAAELVDIRMPEPEYRNFDLGIDSVISAAVQSQVTVLYLDKLLFDNKSFTDENIKAISRFSTLGKSFRHEFFQKKERRYKLLKEISGDASMITTNALNLVADRIVFPEGGIYSIVLVSNADFKGTSSKRSNDILQKRIKKYISRSQG